MKIQTIIGKATLNKLAPFCISIFSVLAFFTIFPIIHRIATEDVEAATGTATSSTINLSVDNDLAAVSLNVGNSNGSFATSSSSEMARFSVTTTNYTGYTLSILASDNDSTLVSEDGEELASITSSLTQNQFNSVNYNNKWGFKPNKLNSSNNTKFLPSPTTSGVTLDSTTSANTTANNYTIALGVRADYTKPSGTYTKSFIITATSNPINYSISFNGNTTDAVSNMPSTKSGNTSATSITLPNNTPTRTGYTFAGWCSVATTKTADGMDDACTGTTYQPSDAYGIDQTTLNEATLYAIWARNSWGYIQDLDITTCKTLATGQDLVVMDRRDNKKYTVQFFDNDCFMTTNLKLAAGITLTPTYSNVTANFTLSSENWESTGQNYKCKQIMAEVDNEYYYNWYAATANPYTCSDPTTTTPTNAMNANSLGDICPKNWWLPTRGKTDVLISNASVVATLSMTGAYVSGSTDGVAQHGFLWTSTPETALIASDGSAMTYGPYSYYFGLPVRCAMKNYMQDQTSSSLSATMPNTGDSTKLADRRDGETYSITNINGLYWMTENLRVTGTVRGEDSNFSATTFNISASDLTSGTSYITAKTHTGTDDTGNPTVWYNYAAASAKTVTGSNNTNDATQDICPKGWHMPTRGELQNVYESSPSLFSPTGGGYYYGSTLSSTELGPYLSSTASTEYQIYHLVYDTNAGAYSYIGNKDRASSGFIRCVFTTNHAYLQDQTATTMNTLLPNSGDESTLYDRRNEREYRVVRIGNAYWMGQNLNIRGTVTATDSNFTGSNFNLMAGGDLTSGNSYDESRTHIPTAAEVAATSHTAEEIGVYYNFYAASAGTISGDTNNNSSTMDICPSGWRLPNRTEITALYGTSLVDTFKPTRGTGLWYGGALRDKSCNTYWSSDASSDTNHYVMTICGAGELAEARNWRYNGMFVRCVLNTQ